MVCRNICEKNILQDNNGKNRYSLGNKYYKGYECYFLTIELIDVVSSLVAPSE